ncbi:YbhB/YbcL family Raf kinase inhibitor-like protein [Streptomyces sp. NBC_00459]|uniref:YbhB/YbcL family Raf kinase inhibitor-like protein n=1 Tax=Streptomyces sp. NBC_00459 TaxID=2975749 RepID=UPI003FA7499D
MSLFRRTKTTDTPAPQEAPVPANPFDRLPPVPSFTVTSTDVKDGEPLATAQYSTRTGIPTAADASPQLSWTGFPEATKSFVVTMYDADAPVPAGFWHWAVADIPAGATELVTGAGAPGGQGLPAGAFHVPNDARLPFYAGAMPPPGTGKHRYFIAVNALDVASVKDLGVADDSTPTVLYFSILQHTIARALITPWGGEG